MQKLERRISALETQADSKSGNLKVHLVPVASGETNAQAIVRAGHSPADEKSMFVCLVALGANRHEQP
ncbi:MAG: hypothetical protein Q8K21_13000 [Hydrogenophaga sp.]|uniref:hypothetical protein n=1 Tax=Hydrogenophaga sp. TaxID=1904254 RepID=UPI00272EFDF7|nr:hypothetical protein [Hydrogenophaga sp.]MDP2165110.1 hypothetical protein [Hydrogenophaga sp.]MDP3476850.1 hypothetical protein [Hydrogenophaga sp.]